MENKTFEIRGRKEDLEVIEKLLKHIEYLGKMGTSKNILVRVDGDGDGRIKIISPKSIDLNKYDIIGNENNVVGIYDIG